MAFPLYIFLIIYLLFLIIWGIFSLVAVYHMVRFGFVNFATFFATLIYIGGAIALLSLSYNYASGIDWGMNVSVFNGMFNFNSLMP